MILLLLALLATPLQDDAWGQCPAFTHYHAPWPEMNYLPNYGFSPEDQKRNRWEANADGLCHRDDNDEPIKERKVLPKPDPKLKWTELRYYREAYPGIDCFDDYCIVLGEIHAADVYFPDPELKWL